METERHAALTTLTYVVRAILARHTGREDRHVGENAQPWAQILDRVTKPMRADVAPVAVPLLSELSRNSRGMTLVQRALVGETARRMLAFAWGHEVRIPVMVSTALQAVCSTFESDPSASAALLRRSLEPRHLASHGYEEMPQLVPKLGRLVPIAPDLVEDVYRSLLVHEETSDEPVPLGQSAIISLISNRRQDFRLAVHQLGELFAVFADIAPVHATGVVIAAVEHEIARMEVKVQFIDVGGAEARLASDSSAEWDCEGRPRHEPRLRMLDEFESMVIRIAQDPARVDSLLGVLRRIVRENRSAAVWRRILCAASACPKTLGVEVRSLAWSLEVLTCLDTREPAGNFVRAIFPLLTDEEKVLVEHTILAIPHAVDEARKSDSEQQRDRLLGCLPSNLLVTDEAKEKLTALEAAGGAPANDPPFSMSWGYSESHYTVWDQFRSEGIPTHEEPWRRIIELGVEADGFRLQFPNGNPGQDEVMKIASTLQALYRDLTAKVCESNQSVTAWAWTNLAGASATIAKADWLEANPEVADFTRRMLLDASTHEVPMSATEQAPCADESIAVSPSPRWYAADGLCHLAWYPSLADQTLRDAIVRLSHDPVAVVRAQIARRLCFLHRTARETALAIFREICLEERNCSVLSAALTGARLLAHSHPEIVAPLAEDVFVRVGKDAGTETVRRMCLQLSLATISEREDLYGSTIVSTALNDLSGNEDVAAELIFIASGRVTYSPVDPPDPRSETIRVRSIDLCLALVQRLATEFARLDAQLERQRGWSDEDRTRVDKLRRIANLLGIRIESAAESIGGENTGHDGNHPVPAETRGARFLRECSPLLDALLEIPFADVVHAVLETLQKLVPLAPGPVLLKVATAVRQGERGAYQFEQLGVGLVVKIVRRYFADYPRLLQGDQSYIRAIMEILNIFVRAGWPEAMELTFRLEEIFR